MNAILAAIVAVGTIPYPNVVRVFAEEGDGSSNGTGILVRSDLVVTNNHVIKTRTGQVRVMFPDWSVYDAEVVKVDKTWDLAALRILPVTIPSMPLGERPEKGDMVTVGGYGPGWYEAHTGPVVKFYQPTRKDASDLFSVDAMVRSGDSGGPVTKGGQLVGVLFGCSDGTYAVTVDRVKRFLEGVR
ncbi:MAG: trypsin-like peptidase domain-containing protein [Planctomycetota bacterium]|jgi:putative serine protease PepD